MKLSLCSARALHGQLNRVALEEALPLDEASDPETLLEEIERRERPGRATRLPARGIR